MKIINDLHLEVVSISELNEGDKVVICETLCPYGYNHGGIPYEYYSVSKVERITPKKTKIYLFGKNGEYRKVLYKFKKGDSEKINTTGTKAILMKRIHNIVGERIDLQKLAESDMETLESAYNNLTAIELWRK